MCKTERQFRAYETVQVKLGLKLYRTSSFKLTLEPQLCITRTLDKFVQKIL